jgi:hypothetical protein
MSNQTSPRRAREGAEAALLLVREKLVEVAVLEAAAELDRRLQAHPLVRLRVGSGREEPVTRDGGKLPSAASVVTPPSISVSA